ncbi:MAG: hypothetical protein Q9194_007202 [Teloschistes cf. exilis]
MAIFPKNGLAHNDPSKAAAAKAHRNAKRNNRKRRTRAAKAEEKASNPAIAAAEKAAVKKKADAREAEKKIKEAEMAKHEPGFWEVDARQASRWLNYQIAQPGKNGLTRDDIISFREWVRSERFAQEREQAVEKLAPGEKLWDCWREGPKGGVALPVSGEEGAGYGEGGEEVEDGDDGEDEDDEADEEGEGCNGSFPT